MNILAIDPGASGGLAWNDVDGTVHAEPMPVGMTAQADKIREIILSRATSDPINCVIEKVGSYVPGNSGPAAATFARHCGNLESILYCYGISTDQVSPQKWMKTLGPFPKDKKERKNAIKEKMGRLYPHLSVTLKIADALGLLTYATGSDNKS